MARRGLGPFEDITPVADEVVIKIPRSAFDPQLLPFCKFICCIMASSERSTCPVAKIAFTEYNRHVYEPSDDTFALVDALVQDSAMWECREPLVCVEVGCGSGYVITSAALAMRSKRKACHFMAVDVTEAAVAATTATLNAHSVQAEVLRSDLLAAFSPRLHQQLDLILFNPPYVVTPDDEVSISGISAAWAGGKHGRVVIDRFLAVVGDFLSPGGLIYMIIVQDNLPNQLMEELISKYRLKSSIVLSRRADEELIHVLRISR
jgi:release factor glutamine methyltransferase